MLEVDNTDEAHPKWLFLFTTSTEKIANYKHRRLIFKIKDVTEIVKRNRELTEKEEKEKKDDNI